MDTQPSSRTAVLPEFAGGSVSATCQPKRSSIESWICCAESGGSISTYQTAGAVPLVLRVRLGLRRVDCRGLGRECSRFDDLCVVAPGEF
jgi:hypothetical protein